jgi:hypothetical protein
MKNIFLSILIFPMLISVADAQELTLEQVMNKFYSANGFDKLQKATTILMTGHITKQDIMPLKILKMRPDKYIMEFDIQDITAYQSYDGQTAWMTAPWTGNNKPQLMTEDAAKDIKAKADFDGSIFDWKEKGHTAELVGKENVNERDTYKIRLIRKDGATEYYFIDASGYLLLKKLAFRMVKGKEIEVSTFYSDYRIIDGIKFAFTNENLMGGDPYSTIEFDTIEINTPLDESIFKKPE